MPIASPVGRTQPAVSLQVVARSALSPGLAVDETLPPVPGTAVLALTPAGPPHPLASRLAEFLREGLDSLAPVRRAA